MFVEDHGHVVVIASNIGAAEHPQWYRNLVADPAVTVERYAATAVTLVRSELSRGSPSWVTTRPARHARSPWSASTPCRMHRGVEHLRAVPPS